MFYKALLYIHYLCANRCAENNITLFYMSMEGNLLTKETQRDAVTAVSKF